MVLGVPAALSEAEVDWRAFLVSLKERGIGIPDSVKSDAHEGLRAALKAVFDATHWQRCQFHLQQNAQAYVPKLDMKKYVAADIRSTFNTSTLAHAKQQHDILIDKYSKSAPERSNWMQPAIPEGLEVLNLPKLKRRHYTHRTHAKTSIIKLNAHQSRRTFSKCKLDSTTRHCNTH